MREVGQEYGEKALAVGAGHAAFQANANLARTCVALALHTKNPGLLGKARIHLEEALRLRPGTGELESLLAEVESRLSGEKSK